nr:11610_t:CDS:2 [Entrophospora candida]
MLETEREKAGTERRKVEIERGKVEIELGKVGIELEKQKRKRIEVEILPNKCFITTQGIQTYERVGEDMWCEASVRPINELLDNIPRFTNEDIPQSNYFIIPESSVKKKQAIGYNYLKLFLGESEDYNIHDTHKTRKLGHQQPDYTLTRKNAVLCWYQTIFFIELKGNLNQDEQLYGGVGQLHERFLSMFEAQPTRSFGFSILTDFDQGFILFKAIKNDNGLTFLRSEIEQMDVGRMILYCLFRAFPSQLGSNHLFNMPSFISIHNIVIKDLHIIRYNSRSKPMILKGIIDSYGSDVVAKIGRKERLTHEYNVLKFINESISKGEMGLPPVIDHGDVILENQNYYAIVIPFYQKCLADLLPEEALSIHNAIKDIAQFLELVKNIGYCHRDVTPMNIYIDENGHGIIADWGISIRTNTTVSNGSMTRFFASNNYLDAAYRNELYLYTHQDDLESLFYCLIDIILPHRKFLPWFNSFSMGMEGQFWIVRKYHMEDANRWIDFKNQACNLLIIENIKDPEKLVEMLECFHQHLYIDKVGTWLDEECHH